MPTSQLEETVVNSSAQTQGKEVTYTTNFTAKFINDPIYGGIGLSQLEVDIINTPIFQRLRNLRQLAFVNLVFPGAEHSRFVHSLGVLFIMGKIVEHLHNKYPHIITKEEQVKLRVAALLHDIGHYPLSHLGEGVYCYKNDLEMTKRIVKGPASKNTVGQSLLTKICVKPKNKSAHHEKLGKYIIENHAEISALLEKVHISPAQIGDIITGDIEAENTIYSQLMHSSLDADRLDYLLRDSYQTGVRYGLVDLDYIIRLLCIGESTIKLGRTSKKVKVIACNKKGKHVIEHYLMSRYFHYSQVIAHKTSLAFEAVAKAMFYKLVEKNQFIFNSYEDIKKNINSSIFLEFNDVTLWEYLKKAYVGGAMDDDYKTFFDVIHQRQRPRTLIDYKDLGDRIEGVPTNFKYRMLKALLNSNPKLVSEALNINQEHIGCQEMKVNVESIPTCVELDCENTDDKYDKDMREAIRVIDDANVVTLLVKDTESVINKLTDLTAGSLRIFYIEPENIEKERLDEMNFSAKECIEAALAE